VFKTCTDLENLVKIENKVFFIWVWGFLRVSSKCGMFSRFFGWGYLDLGANQTSHFFGSILFDLSYNPSLQSP